MVFAILWMGMTKCFANTGCYVAAGERYNIDPVLIYSIAEQESSHNVLAVNNKNKNKTVDYGIMQINSVWLPSLKKDYGTLTKDLYDPCYNIHVGSWILLKAFQKLGYGWKAIGAYNVGYANTPIKERLRAAYAQKIYVKYAKNCRLYRCTGTFRLY